MRLNEKHGILRKIFKHGNFSLFLVTCAKLTIEGFYIRIIIITLIIQLMQVNQ